MSTLAKNKSQAMWLAADDTPQWDEFVGRHQRGVVYHLSAWKATLEWAFPHIKGRFLVLRDNENCIIAGLPVYTVRSWLLGNRVVSVPFASILDPLVASPQEMQSLLTAALEERTSTAARHFELRTLRTGDWVPRAGATVSTLYRHHYLPLVKEPEELSLEFARTAIRRWFTRAPKKGVRVALAQDIDAMRQFHSVFLQTRRRLSLPPIPLRFFEALWSKFGKERLALFLATLEGELIGGLLALNFNRTLHLEFSGDSPGAYHVGSNQLLHWEAIKYAWSQGCQQMSFGRTSSLNEGLIEYKRRWATTEEPVTIFRFRSDGRVASQTTKPSRMYDVTRWVLGKAPTPVVRHMGAFIYRHLG